MPCLDCGRPDEKMPLDTVLTLKQWEWLCPEGGVLCASCIVVRAAKLPDVINICARVVFVDDYSGDEPGGRFYSSIVALDG